MNQTIRILLDYTVEVTMKPFRKNLAIALDGGGLRGLIATRALMTLEKELGHSVSQEAKLLAGSSTGSVISAAIASGYSAAEIHNLYLELAGTIFKKSWRTFPILKYLANYQYSQTPLAEALLSKFKDRKVVDFWSQTPPVDLVITTFDILANRTRYIKSWKSEYRDWPLVKAVLASSAAPTYFPIVEGQFTDGGVGSFNNPCYLAAYEAKFCLEWKPEETTLLSLGTGRNPANLRPGAPQKWTQLDWVHPLFEAFLDSANDQQVHVVDTFFKKLDFRRFQVDLRETIALDDPNQIQALEEYGVQMGEMILNDQFDRAQNIPIVHAS
jgi:patatin-like phospholipase/acyl hydrolase